MPFFQRTKGGKKPSMQDQIGRVMIKPRPLPLPEAYFMRHASFPFGSLGATLQELDKPIRGPQDMPRQIELHRYALALVNRDQQPELWGTLHNDMANRLLANPQGIRADNIEQAIGHYQQALEVFTRHTFPIPWAVAHNNLGDAYCLRILGEHADNLEQAIGHYQQTLEVAKRDVHPDGWAGTLDNLATAYRNRIRGERADNLEQAISLLQKSLEVYTHDAFPVEWAAALTNLGTAFFKRIRGKRYDNLDESIDHYQLALKVFTRAAFPDRWSEVQNYLATVYRERTLWDRADNLEQAIGHCKQALKVRTRTAFPEEWAETQSNLASAYRDRIRGKRADNLKQAISHYQEALKVYTRAAFPADHRETQRNLGNLFFGEHRWAEALTAYKQAIDAGNDLLAAAYTEAGRQAEVGETMQLYSRAAYCLLQVGHPGDALVMLERGKTRLLAEALALGDLDLKSLPEQQRASLQAARQALKALEAEMRLSADTPARRENRTLADLLRSQRAELNTLIGVIRRDHPDFMSLGLELGDILQLIPTDGALVAPLITAQGSVVFIVPQGVTEVTLTHVVPLDGFKDDDLNALLRGTDEQPGWLHAYGDYHTTHRLNNLQAAIESLTGRLWQVLIAPIHERLLAVNVKRLLLLPSGGLQLLPLHAAWHVDKDKQARTLLDDYEIIYAPSTYALATARHRAVERKGNTALVAGVNAYQKLSPLHNAAPEAAAVACVLHVTPLLDSTATEQAIKAGAPDAAYLHLSCHGSFNWGAPMDSALYLANDEPLRLSEIIGELDLGSVRLVTLSACETGISDVSQSPDEYIGLPAGFLQAGAPALVSSLWTVDDRSTALLMERFYRNHIEHNMTCPAALREAQLWLRTATRQELGDYYKTFLRMSANDAFAGFMELNLERDGKPDDRPYANPFYWAAFTFIGASE
jgi:CHAT domain-containing protein/tetratricopeptide (TPR) repeat protein